MSSNFNQISLNNISKSILDQLYDIHFHTYERKNTGLKRETWESNLKRDYHLHSRKQLFTYSHLGKDTLIDGYIIIAGTHMVQNNHWNKILEGAAHPQGSYINSVSAFTEMFYHFLIYAEEMKWNLWGEISYLHKSIFKLLINFGFSPIDQFELANSLCSIFLGAEARYRLQKANSKIFSHRPTQLNTDYSGFIISYEQSVNCNLIKQNQQHEYNR